MFTAQDLLDGDVLLPGDLVVDDATHKPMFVTGYDTRPVEEVSEVWDSNVNRYKYDIHPGDRVVELVNAPTGTHYFVPESVERYPAKRLSRHLVEPATSERRPQQKVVRAVVSMLVSDAREMDKETFADAILALCRQRWPDDFVDEIEEFSQEYRFTDAIADD